MTGSILVPSDRAAMARLLSKRLPARAHDILRSAGKFGMDRGTAVYAVGGFVRDLLLGRENLDLDLVVEGDGISFAREFARSQRASWKGFNRFGTAAVYFKDGIKVDVATARREVYDRPAALPRVAGATIRYDLSRRDFTINSLALSLSPETFGHLIDLFGGLEDLNRRRIRVLHGGSFVDDPTRAFRAVRFAHRFGFRISRRTADLIRRPRAPGSGLFDRLSGKRLFNEVKLLLSEPRPGKAIALLERHGLLKVIHPRLAWTPHVSRLFLRAGRAILLAEKTATWPRVEPWLLYFFALVDPLSQAELEEVRSRLDINMKKERQAIAKRRAGYVALERLSGAARPSNSHVYHLLGGLPADLLVYLFARADRGQGRRAIGNFLSSLRSVRLALRGEDLAALGIAPGPLYGVVMSRVLDARLDGLVTTRREEIGLARVLIEKRTKKGNLERREGVGRGYQADFHTGGAGPSGHHLP